MGQVGVDDHRAAAPELAQPVAPGGGGVVERAGVVDNGQPEPGGPLEHIRIRRHHERGHRRGGLHDLLGPGLAERRAPRQRRGCRRGAPYRARTRGSGSRPRSPSSKVRHRGRSSRCVRQEEAGNIAARMLPNVESAASVAVIGAGSWGTTVAAIMSGHAPTTLWGRNPELVDAIATRHENPAYLPGIALPEGLRATTDLAAACAGARVVVMAVPSHGYRAVLEEAASRIRTDVPVVSLAKGIERGTLLRMTEVTLEVLTGHDAQRVAVLTGPNLAREVAEGQPAASVIACSRRRDRPRAPAALHEPQLPRVHQPRRDRLRGRRRDEERDRDRVRYRRRSRVRRQHPGGPDHSRARRGGAPRGRARRRADDLRRPRRPRRPRRHLHQPEEPQPQRRVRARPWSLARRDRRADRTWWPKA